MPLVPNSLTTRPQLILPQTTRSQFIQSQVTQPNPIQSSQTHTDSNGWDTWDDFGQSLFILVVSLNVFLCKASWNEPADTSKWMENSNALLSESSLSSSSLDADSKTKQNQDLMLKKEERRARIEALKQKRREKD